MNRLLFHREKRNEVEGADGTTTSTKFGYYGVLDLVTRDEVVLLQRMDRHIHSSSIMHITRDQTKIVHYSKWTNAATARKEGMVQINSLETGELFGSIQCDEEMVCIFPNVLAQSLLNDHNLFGCF